MPSAKKRKGKKRGKKPSKATVCIADLSSSEIPKKTADSLQRLIASILSEPPDIGMSGSTDVLFAMHVMNDASIVPMWVNANSDLDINALEEDSGLSALELAASNGNYLFVYSMLNCGKTIDPVNVKNAFLRCCRGASFPAARVPDEIKTSCPRAEAPDYAKTARLLVEAGASANTTDKSGASGLILACDVHPDIYDGDKQYAHSLNLVRYLLAAGADPHYTPHDRTTKFQIESALLTSVETRQELIAEMLISSAGVDVNKAANQFGTPVFVGACREGLGPAVKAILGSVGWAPTDQEEIDTALVSTVD
jgi:ankyrin repeat protein